MYLCLRDSEHQSQTVFYQIHRERSEGQKLLVSVSSRESLTAGM